jgi:prepilin-type N-terminal cleavage/methylation domain-containing protein
MVVGKDKAFTLIEVIIVIGVLAILTAITVPSLLQYNDRWMLRSTAYMIANDIRLMQSLSIQECIDHKFELHTKQFYYLTLKDRTTSDFGKRVVLDSRITEINSTLYDPKYTGQMNGYRILKFNYLGTPNQGGTIELKTKSGYFIKLTVEVVTGRVLVGEVRSYD